MSRLYRRRVAGVSLGGQLLRALTLCCATGWPCEAFADSAVTLSGLWQSSPLSATWTVQSWSPECGEPPSGGTEPGGFVTVKEQAGELLIEGGGKRYSSANCLDESPSLQRVSHSSSARSWSSVCKSSAGNARPMTVRTALRASDATIDVEESSQVSFERDGKHCSATLQRTRQLRLIERASGAPAKPDATGKSDATGATTAAARSLTVETPEQAEQRRLLCEAPGPVRTLTLKPEHKLLKRGDSFQVEVALRDANGCAVPSKAVQWALDPPLDGVGSLGGGRVEASEQAQEGQTHLVARAGQRSARVQLTVVSQGTFDALLALPAASAAPAVPAQTATELAAVESSAAVAEDSARRRKLWFGAFVTFTAALLGGLGFVVLRQARRNERHGTTTVSLVPHSIPPAASKICPTCGSMYGTEAQFCGKDGSCLVQTN